MDNNNIPQIWLNWNGMQIPVYGIFPIPHWMIVKPCPNDCPMKKNNKCIATKCIFDNPSVLEPVKIGEKDK